MGENEEKIKRLKELIAEDLEADSSFFLIDINIHSTNEINIIMDKDGGMTIGECAQLSKLVYKKITERALFTNDDFQLELSSPGVDSPLVLKRQFENNKGRTLEIITHTDDVIVGKILETSDSFILVETKIGKGKKITVQQRQVLYGDIKSAIVQVSFK